MLRGIVTILAVVAIQIAWLFSTPFASSAAPQCDERANVISVLSNKYKERQVAVGVTQNGALLEIWTSEGGETWSILMSAPGGTTCLVSAGEGWQSMALVVPGSDS